jgi:hypothetical protein
VAGLNLGKNMLPRTASIQPADFKSLAPATRGFLNYDLRVVASKLELSESEMQALAIEHMPPI